MSTLLDVIKKVASSASATVPACDSAAAHKRVDERTQNKVMPWARGRKPIVRKEAGAACRQAAAESGNLDARRIKQILKAKRRSTPPHVIKAANVTYADLGNQKTNRGMSPLMRGVNQYAFNRLVDFGLKNKPQNSFGERLRTGLRAGRSSGGGGSGTGPSAARLPGGESSGTASSEPGFWNNLIGGPDSFWGKLTGGDAYGAVDAYNKNELSKSWARRVGEGTGAAAQGALYAVPGARLGQKATKMMGAVGAGSVLPGPSFEQRMVYAPLALAKHTMHDLPETRRNWAAARRGNLEAAETDPERRRMNSFRRWIDDYGHDPAVIQANLPSMFPDLWKRWQAGERWGSDGGPLAYGRFVRKR